VSNTKRPSVENGSVKFSDSDISVNGSGVLLVNLEGTDEKFGDSLVIDLANAASPVPAPSTFAPLVPVWSVLPEQSAASFSTGREGHNAALAASSETAFSYRLAGVWIAFFRRLLTVYQSTWPELIKGWAP
jgi:hypothetical protein